MSEIKFSCKMHNNDWQILCKTDFSAVFACNSNFSRLEAQSPCCESVMVIDNYNEQYLICDDCRRSYNYHYLDSRMLDNRMLDARKISNYCYGRENWESFINEWLVNCLLNPLDQIMAASSIVLGFDGIRRGLRRLSGPMFLGHSDFSTVSHNLHALLEEYSGPLS